VLPLLRADDKAMARSALARQETATPSRPDSTWIVAGLALLTLFAGGLGWVALRVRRNPAPEADGAALEIEAELQEIIAEQRAEELTRREASGVAGPPG